MTDNREQQPMASEASDLQSPKRGISRRSMVLWFAGVIAAEIVASGITWQKVLQELPTIFAQNRDLPGSSLLLTYGVRGSPVLSVAWSPDGKSIASASADKSVRVWDAGSGKTLLTYGGHAASVYSVAWSPDGKSIASGGDDGIVQVW